MLKDYLEPSIYALIIKSFSFDDITEIRLRVGHKVIITVKNKKFYLKDSNGDYVYVSKCVLENFITKASENSIYAFNDCIVNGFITIKNGIRIGICGNVVTCDGKVVTIKDFQSVNIRIPHIIKNCSLQAYEFLVKDNNVLNTLIISAPGSGKTTFLRDFVYQLFNHGVSKNVLIADERNEICSIQNSETFIDLGDFCDIYTNCSKSFAFKNGIRSMRPDVIVADELDVDNDLNCLIEAINSGVNVVATVHAKDINQLKNKKGFSEILNQKFFSRFVVLNDDDGPGSLSYIYDEKLNCIFCRWLWKYSLFWCWLWLLW